MPLCIKDLLDVLDRIAPFAMAESWDNVGLMVGNPDMPVSGVLLALDLTEAVLDEAVVLGINTIVTHHPMIMKPLISVRTDQPVGRELNKALSSGIAVIGCHTNFDAAPGGVNDILAARLGLEDTMPLVQKAVFMPGNSKNSVSSSLTGLGRIGRLATPVKAEVFVRCLLDQLQISVCRISGRMPEMIGVVAVCGGSGSDLAEAAFTMGAHVYITGEVKHSVARWAEAMNFCIIDAGHFDTENQIVPVLVSKLQSILGEGAQGIDVRATANQKSPWRNYFSHRPMSVDISLY